MRAGSALACVLAMLVSVTQPLFAERDSLLRAPVRRPVPPLSRGAPDAERVRRGVLRAGIRHAGVDAKAQLVCGLGERALRVAAGSEGAGRRPGYLNRIEVISGGKLVAPWLSYFVEWRPVSEEARSDGTRQARSGRFEDLFVTAASRHAELTVGQFRQLAQVDVSRRLGLSEPLVLSASLADPRSGSPRERPLRAFAPAGRSPSVRASPSPSCAESSRRSGRTPSMMMRTATW